MHLFALQNTVCLGVYLLIASLVCATRHSTHTSSTIQVCLGLGCRYPHQIRLLCLQSLWGGLQVQCCPPPTWAQS